MSVLGDPGQEHPGNRSAQKRLEDRSHWLTLACKMLIAEMGGVLPEQPPGSHYRRVLDVGCNTGYWLFKVAKTYPDLPRLYGVDLNRRLVLRARALIRERELDERIEFHTMDPLRMLEFPFDYVDLVNIQLGSHFVRTWEWSKLLQEARRVTRLGGIIRAVEQDSIAESSSPAFNRLTRLFVRASYQAGHLFAPEYTGLLDEMPRLFDQFGVREIQTHLYTRELRADTPGWQPFAHAILLAMTPFVAKWSRLPEDYESLCQQALEEIALPDFVARWNVLVIWGMK